MNDNDHVVLERYDPDKTYNKQKRFDCENKIINKFIAGSEAVPLIRTLKAVS